MIILIPLVENVLSEIIESRLKFIKENIDIVDRIFSGASITIRSRLKNYISKDSIKVLRGYPADVASLPCYVIMLGGEREQEKYLGSSIGDTEIFETENKIEELSILVHDGIYVVQVSKKPIYAVNTITYNGEEDAFAFEVLDERKGIIRLDFPVDLDISNTVIVDYDYKRKGYEQYGTTFVSQYRIETWTNNGDLTVLLYYLLKWIFLSAREELESKGVWVQTLGGLDFEPSPEYFPEFVYRRALTFECIQENTFEEEYSYIQKIIVKGDWEV